MHSSDKIKQLLTYLFKNYYIKDEKFFDVYSDVQICGRDISKCLFVIFSFDEELCENTLKHWAYLNGLSSESIIDAWKPYGLQTVWSPNLAQDLIFNGVDIYSELARNINEVMSVELDRELLNSLQNNL